MVLCLKSGPQIAEKTGIPAGLLLWQIRYSVWKSGVLGITEYRQGRPLHICVVKFDITCNIIRKDWKLCYYDYRHGNYEAMKVYLAEMDWSFFINCEDCIEVPSRFVKMMKDLVAKLVPKKMKERNRCGGTCMYPESGEEENEKLG